MPAGIKDSYVHTARIAARKAYAEAGITRPRDQISMTEVHDCFSITELVTMEDLGLSEEGQAVRDILKGDFDADGRVPCQIDGGLKCFGHPIGASGIRMVYEMYLQLQGRAGPRQTGQSHDRPHAQPGRAAVAKRVPGFHRRPGRGLSTWLSMPTTRRWCK